jgi:membrane-associated phospholipid phosphatase
MNGPTRAVQTVFRASNDGAILLRLKRRAAATVLFATTLASPVAAQSDTIGPRPLFTAADAALAGGFIVGTFLVRPFDRTLARHLRDPQTQANKFFSGTATTVREITEPGAFIIGGTMYVVGRATHNARAADLGWHGTEAVLVASLAGDILKGAFGRARPYVDSAFNPNDFKFGRGFGRDDRFRSFPSGHTLAAFAAAAAVADETSRWWPRSTWLIGSAMYGGAALVGLSRMYNNMHWASDVIVGAAIGTFAGIKVVRYHQSHPGNRLDRWILGGSITPKKGGGASLAWAVIPR